MPINHSKEIFSSAGQQPLSGEGVPGGFYLKIQPNPDFCGRENDIQYLAERLGISEDVMPDLVARKGMIISGPSGIGKTELAVEFCHRYRHHFYEIFWLQAEYNIGSQIVIYGQKMGLADDDLDQKTQVEKILHAWRENGPNLIVFDHADNMEDIAKWLHHFETFHIIITSRYEDNWHNIYGFETYIPEPFSSECSISLLLKVAPHLNSQDQNVKNVIQMMEGLPQALNLAGRCMTFDLDISPQDYIKEIESARIILTKAIRESAENILEPQPVPILALAYAVCWKVIKNQRYNDISWKVFQACGYCAPNLPIPWEILKECFSIDRKQLEEKLERAVDFLYRLGLLIEANEGPIILHQLSEFSRWIEMVSEEGSMLPRLSDSLAMLARYNNEQKKTQLMQTMQEHLREVAFASEKAGFDKTAGALFNSLGYHYWLVKDYEKATKYLEKSLRITESMYGSDHSNVAAVVNNLGDVLLSQEKLPGARVCFENAIRIWENSLGSEHLNVAKAASNLANVMKKQGDLYGAQTNLEKALVILSKEFGNEHPRIASTIEEMGDVLFDLGELDEALTCYERTLAIEEADQNTLPEKSSVTILKIASILTTQEKYAQAQIYYEKAFLIQSDLSDLQDENLIETIKTLIDNYSLQGFIPSIPLAIDEQSLYDGFQIILQYFSGEYSISTAQHLSRLGDKFEAIQQISLARHSYEKALLILHAIPDVNRSLLAETTRRLSKVLLSLGKHQTAEEHAQRALLDLESKYGARHPELLPFLNNLGEIYLEQGKHQLAIDCFTRSIDIGEETFGTESPQLTSSLNHLGSVYWSQGKLKDAERCFEHALKIDENTFGENHPNVSRDINNLGDTLYRQNDLQNARKYFERALKIEEAHYGPDHPNVASVINNLAAVLLAQQKLNEAKALFERAYQIDEAHFGKNHLNVARDARNLGNTFKAIGEPDRAKDFYLLALSIREQLLPAYHPKILALQECLRQLSEKAEPGTTEHFKE